MFLHVKQRPHPTPTLQGESCVNLIISKTIEKTKQKTKQPKRPKQKQLTTIGKTKKNKTTKEVKAKTIKNHWENKKNNNNNKTFGPMTLFGDIGPTVFFVVGFPNGF